MYIALRQADRDIDIICDIDIGKDATSKNNHEFIKKKLTFVGIILHKFIDSESFCSSWDWLRPIMFTFIRQNSV